MRRIEDKRRGFLKLEFQNALKALVNGYCYEGLNLNDIMNVFDSIASIPEIDRTDWARGRIARLNEVDAPDEN